MDEGRHTDAHELREGLIPLIGNRLEALGGRLEIRSAPRRGTTVAGMVPAGGGGT
jgi:signal transduction histidine kinase